MPRKILKGFTLIELLVVIAIITIVFVALHLINIPSSLYQTFVIEGKYGFNKITPTPSPGTKPLAL